MALRWNRGVALNLSFLLCAAWLTAWNLFTFGIYCVSFWLLQGMISIVFVRAATIWKCFLLLYVAFLLLQASTPPIANLVDKNLRILPLGDSVTWGYGSSDWNGYRQHLLDALVGNNVEYIGSLHTGQMDRNANEGRPGERLNQTIRHSSASLHQRPNIILLNAANNDMVYDDNVAEAPKRLELLLEDIFKICPDATVILAHLGPSPNSDYQARMTAFNEAMPAVAGAFLRKGKHILIAETSAINVNEDLFDDLHYNDAGYFKLARSFYAAIDLANANGWITTPVHVSRKKLVLETACTSLPQWLPLPVLFPGFDSPPPDARYLWADIDGDSRDDFLVLAPDGTLQPYLNVPNPVPEVGKLIEWWPEPSISTPAQSPSSSSGGGGGGGASGPPLLLVADLTGSSFASLIYAYPDGSILAAANAGPDPSTGQLHFREPVLIADARQAPADPLGIRFHDIDGDGRADLVYISPTGSMAVWLNRAALQRHSFSKPDPTALEIEWIAQGEIVGSVPGIARKDVRLADLNGDGLADYLLVEPETGAVEGWLNKGLEQWYKEALESEKLLGQKNWVESSLSGLNKGKDKSKDKEKEREKEKEKEKEKDKKKSATAVSPPGPASTGKDGSKAKATSKTAEEKAAANEAAAVKPGNIYGGGGGLPSLMIERTFWHWEELGLVAEGAGRGDVGLPALGVGAPGVAFADIAGSRRAAYLFVEQNGAVTGWGNGCGEDSIGFA